MPCVFEEIQKLMLSLPLRMTSLLSIPRTWRLFLWIFSFIGMRALYDPVFINIYKQDMTNNKWYLDH